MPVFVIKPADKDMPADEAAMILYDFDSTIKIISENDSGVEVEMTEQQAGDFLTIYTDWQAKKIAYADINKPALNLGNMRKALDRNKNQPS